MPNPDDPIHADQIANQLHVNVHTIRRLFRTGAIRGKKVGLHGWTTTHTTYQAWLDTWQPDLTTHPLTTGEIATQLGVHVLTVRRLFTLHGAPGKKIRTPIERTAYWRADPDVFWPWHAARVAGQDTPAAAEHENAPST